MTDRMRHLPCGQAVNSDPASSLFANNPHAAPPGSVLLQTGHGETIPAECTDPPDQSAVKNLTRDDERRIRRIHDDIRSGNAVLRFIKKNIFPWPVLSLGNRHGTGRKHGSDGLVFKIRQGGISKIRITGSCRDGPVRIPVKFPQGC